MPRSLLRVLHLGSVVRAFLHLTPLALEANFIGSSIMVVSSACYPCSFAMGCAFGPLIARVSRFNPLALKANLSGFGFTVAVGGLPFHVCLL